MKVKEVFDVEIADLIPKLKSYIRAFIYDEDLVNDILQDTLITALSKLLELEEPFNISGWIRTIARNKCLNFLKKQRKMVGFDNIPESYFQNLTNPDESDSEEEEQLVSSLGNLPHSQKYIVQLKYFTHHSIKEISKLLKLPEGTVKRRLFDARNKLRKEMEMNKEQGKRDKEQRIAPEIKIIPKKESKKKSVKILGYGLCFGAPIAGIGDVEVYEAYEYPGRIFVRKAVSKVTRKTQMLDHEVWEVKDEFVDKKQDFSRSLYFTFDEKRIYNILRICNHPHNLRVDIEQKELMDPLELEVKVGEFENPERDNEICIVDVVDMKIGERNYQDMFRKRFSNDKPHGRAFSEKFINAEGREIIRRNYIGENWEMGGFVTWEKWKDAPEIEFKGEKFRLWFEFILVDHYKEK